jgi:hypothetical protein
VHRYFKGKGFELTIRGFAQAPNANDKGKDSTRVIQLGSANPGYVGNTIKTSKYNVITFFPIFLFEMFSRAAYLYFLVQVRTYFGMFS